MKANNAKGSLILLKILPLLALLLIGFIALCIGTKFISPLSFLNRTCSKTDFIVITKIRLPRILLSIMCGALLGGTGAVFQGFFRNPLADPGIMGVCSGATFGAVVSGLLPIAAVSFLSPTTFFAFGGALLSAFCVFMFSKVFRGNSSVTLLLSGKFKNFKESL